MESTPRRRWFRFAFSLRTLFVVVTIFGVWLGWQRYIVQQRQEIIRELSGKYGSSHGTNHFDGLMVMEISDYPPEFRSRVDFVQISTVRRLLGDRAIVSLELPDNLPPEMTERVELAFPEARLSITYSEGFEFDRSTRDSVFVPPDRRLPNTGTIFKTGLIEK